MKLITKQLEVVFEKYPLYSQDGKGKDAKVLCKFFLNSFTWYVLEFDGNDTFFGIIINGSDGEYGYFSLSELKRVRGLFGLSVERDRCFKPTTIEKSTDYYLQEFYKNHLS